MEKNWFVIFYFVLACILAMSILNTVFLGYYDQKCQEMYGVEFKAGSLNDTNYCFAVIPTINNSLMHGFDMKKYILNLSSDNHTTSVDSGMIKHPMEAMSYDNAD